MESLKKTCLEVVHGLKDKYLSLGITVYRPLSLPHGKMCQRKPSKAPELLTEEDNKTFILLQLDKYLFNVIVICILRQRFRRNSTKCWQETFIYLYVYIQPL